MGNEWVEEQRQRIGESQKRLDELKTGLTPKRRAELPQGAATPPLPPLAERLRKRRFWIVVTLACINANLLVTAIHDQLTRPTSATLFDLPTNQVRLMESTTGAKSYDVTVPLDDRHYWIELNQGQESQRLAAALLNLILLAVILHSYWQGSRAKSAAKPREPNSS